MVAATRQQWLELTSLDLQSGDVLIKRIWTRHDGAERNRGGVEFAIRAAAAMHWFDKNGSPFAEHAAMVGSVRGQARIIEADEHGIALKTVEQTAHNGEENTYLVCRFIWQNALSKDAMRLLCDGMATRLAQIQGEAPGPLLQNNYPLVAIDSRIWEVAQNAHFPHNQPSDQPYAKFVAFHSSVSPTLLPDTPHRMVPQFLHPLFSRHDERILDFIAGENRSISYICSGLVASLLQAWSVHRFGIRKFTDPSLIHPTGLEHHILSNSFPGLDVRGRWGGAVLADQFANNLIAMVDRASHVYENQFGPGIEATGIGFLTLKFGGHRKSDGLKRANYLKSSIRSAATNVERLNALENFFVGSGSYKQQSLKRLVAYELFVHLYPALLNVPTDQEVERKVFHAIGHMRRNI